MQDVACNADVVTGLVTVAEVTLSTTARALYNCVHGHCPSADATTTSTTTSSSTSEPCDDTNSFCVFATPFLCHHTAISAFREQCPRSCQLCHLLPSTPAPSMTASSTSSSTFNRQQDTCLGKLDAPVCGNIFKLYQCNNPLPQVAADIRQTCPVMCHACSTTTTTTTGTSTSVSTTSTTSGARCNGEPDSEICGMFFVKQQCVGANKAIASYLGGACPALCSTCRPTSTSAATTTTYTRQMCNGVLENSECGGIFQKSECGYLLVQNHCPSMCGSCTSTSTTTMITTYAYVPQTCHGMLESPLCGAVYDETECASTVVRQTCPAMCGVCSSTTTAAAVYQPQLCNGQAELSTCGIVFDLSECGADTVRKNCPAMCGVCTCTNDDYDHDCSRLLRSAGLQRAGRIPLVWGRAGHR